MNELVVRSAEPRLRRDIQGLVGYSERSAGPTRQREPAGTGVVLIFGLGPELRLFDPTDPARPPMRLGSFVAGPDGALGVGAPALGVDEVGLPGLVPDRLQEAALDAAADAANRWLYPDDTLDPWEGVRWQAVAGSPYPTHAIDASAGLERGVQAVLAHRTYIQELTDEDPETYVRGFLGRNMTEAGARFGGGVAVSFEVFQRDPYRRRTERRRTEHERRNAERNAMRSQGGSGYQRQHQRDRDRPHGPPSAVHSSTATQSSSTGTGRCCSAAPTPEVDVDEIHTDVEIPPVPVVEAASDAATVPVAPATPSPIEPEPPAIATPIAVSVAPSLRIDASRPRSAGEMRSVPTSPSSAATVLASGASSNSNVNVVTVESSVESHGNGNAKGHGKSK